MAFTSTNNARIGPFGVSRPTMHPREWALAAGGGHVVDRPAVLREMMTRPGLLVGPCCHDALSAKLIERAGFPFVFMSGFTTSAARLGAPDAGLITFTEMLDTGLSVHEATHSIPVIGDGDNGYGNVVNVRRTVGAYARAGFAGVLIEDQIAPKSCGHVRGKRVLSRGEAVMKIRAAADERDESGTGICILARTDARRADSLDEALWRVAAFADAGADILFIDALDSKEEMRRFCELRGVEEVPKLANMLEGGRSPLLTLGELEEMGFKLVAYPLSLLGVSIRAMEDALVGLKQGKIPPPAKLPTFETIQEVVGFPEYFDLCERYAAAKLEADTFVTAGSEVGTSADTAVARPSSSAPSFQTQEPRSLAKMDTPQSRNGTSAPEVVEADEIITREDFQFGTGRNREYSSGTGERPLDARGPEVDSGSSQESGVVKPRSIRVCVRQQVTGKIEFETRIPSSFISGLSSLVPNAGGLEQMVTAALGSEWDPNSPVISFPSNGTNIEVFFE